MSNKTDTLLENVIATHGPNARTALVKLQTLIEEFIAMPFNTRKATQDEIQRSFNLLHRIYTTTLSTEREYIVPAIQFLVNCISNERHGAFSAFRINMVPNLEQGSSKSSLKYVADLNQLFANLATARNARELRSRVRLEPIFDNIRSDSQRANLNLYIASIDH